MFYTGAGKQSGFRIALLALFPKNCIALQFSFGNRVAIALHCSQFLAIALRLLCIAGKFYFFKIFNGVLFRILERLEWALIWNRRKSRLTRGDPSDVAKLAPGTWSQYFIEQKFFTYYLLIILTLNRSFHHAIDGSIWFRF